MSQSQHSSLFVPLLRQMQYRKTIRPMPPACVSLLHSGNRVTGSNYSSALEIAVKLED